MGGRAATRDISMNIYSPRFFFNLQIHTIHPFVARRFTTRLGMPVAGTFVYQKKNRSNPRPGADACEIKCKKLSCDIQRCISRLPTTRTRTSSATVNHSACDYAVERYNACCERVKALESGGKDASSSA